MEEARILRPSGDRYRGESVGSGMSIEGIKVGSR